MLRVAPPAPPPPPPPRTLQNPCVTQWKPSSGLSCPDRSECSPQLRNPKIWTGSLLHAPPATRPRVPVCPSRTACLTCTPSRTHSGLWTFLWTQESSADQDQGQNTHNVFRHFLKPPLSGPVRIGVLSPPAFLDPVAPGQPGPHTPELISHLV